MSFSKRLLKLDQCLGYASVGEVQVKAISSVVAGKDHVFISLPTRTGKSLCLALVLLVFA